MSSTGLVSLVCGHSRIFRPAPPKRGEQVWCDRCRSYQDVAGQLAEIRLRCRDCKLSRGKGVGGETDLSLSDARALASGHVARNPGHRVDVTDSDGKVVTIANDGQGELPFADVVQQRVADSREQQSGLRGAFNRSRRAMEPRSDDG